MLTLVGVTTNIHAPTAAGSGSVALHGDAEAGDLCILIGADGVANRTPAASGFTLIGGQANSNRHKVTALWKNLTEADITAGSIAFTWDENATWVVACVVFRGHNPLSPISDWASDVTGTPASFASVTTTEDHSFVLSGVIVESAGDNLDTWTGRTELLDMGNAGDHYTNYVHLGVAYKDVSPAGASGTGSVATSISFAEGTKFQFLVVAGTPDTTPPTVPTDFAAGTPTATTVPLTWTASADAVGVAGYKLKTNGGGPVNLPVGTAYTARILQPATAYTFELAAYDGAGNVSAYTSPVTATTAAAEADTVYPGGTAYGGWAADGAAADVGPGAKTFTRDGNAIATAGSLAALPDGFPARVSSTGTLPAGVNKGRRYFGRWATQGAGPYTLYPTAADAIAGTNAVTLSDAGSGTHTVTPQGQTSDPIAGWVGLNRVVVRGVDGALARCFGVYAEHINGIDEVAVRMDGGAAAGGVDLTLDGSAGLTLGRNQFSTPESRQVTADAGTDVLTLATPIDPRFAVLGVRMTSTGSLPAAQLSATFTANATTNTIAPAADYPPQDLAAPVTFTSSGTLPAGLAAATTYWIPATLSATLEANDRKVYPTEADCLADTNPVDITDAGTGTHTVHRAVELGDWVFARFDTTGTCKLYWTCSGAIAQAFPIDLTSAGTGTLTLHFWASRLPAYWFKVPADMADGWHAVRATITPRHAGKVMHLQGEENSTASPSTPSLPWSRLSMQLYADQSNSLGYVVVSGTGSAAGTPAVKAWASSADPAAVTDRYASIAAAVAAVPDGGIVFVAGGYAGAGPVSLTRNFTRFTELRPLPDAAPGACRITVAADAGTNSQVTWLLPRGLVFEALFAYLGGGGSGNYWATDACAGAAGTLWANTSGKTVLAQFNTTLVEGITQTFVGGLTGAQSGDIYGPPAMNLMPLHRGSAQVGGQHADFFQTLAAINGLILYGTYADGCGDAINAIHQHEATQNAENIAFTNNVFLRFGNAQINLPMTGPYTGQPNVYTKHYLCNHNVNLPSGILLNIDMGDPVDLQAVGNVYALRQAAVISGPVAGVDEPYNCIDWRHNHATNDSSAYGPTDTFGEGHGLAELSARPDVSSPLVGIVTSPVRKFDIEGTEVGATDTVGAYTVFVATDPGGGGTVSTVRGNTCTQALILGLL